METEWLTEDERAAWLRLIAVVELLPGVLDSQLRADSGLTHFEYFVLAMLSEAPERTLRMTSLAQRTNATLPRLSHVVNRLEGAASWSVSPAPRTGAPPTPGSLQWDGMPSSPPRRDTSTTVRRSVARPAHPHSAQAAAQHRRRPAHPPRPRRATDRALRPGIGEGERP